jgi:hypothetical protein
MPLKISLLPKIKKDRKLVRALEDLHGRSFYTIQLWIKDNNPLLSTIDSLQVISAYMHVDIDDLIEKKEVPVI